MRRRSSFLFILVNIFVSLGVVLVVIALLNQNRSQQADTVPVVVTVPVVITATPNPSAGPTIIIITPTLPPNFVQLPTELISELQTQGVVTNSSLPSLDTTPGAPAAQIADASTALPQNCIVVTLEAGDTPSGFALEYGVTTADILAVNGLSEDDASFLQIGQTLVIPLEGCPLTAPSLAATQTSAVLPSATPVTPTPTPSNTSAFTATPTATPSATSTVSATPTATFTASSTPTATLPPTAVNAQVAITRIIDAGNITAEGVEIRNNGPVIDLSGWTLRDAEGNAYIFPNERRLFQGGSLTVFTRVGDDTPIALYWDRQQAAYTSGEAVTLADREGRAQSVATVP
jgi:LysM repeat protein